jgi:hypothetical protein
VIAFAHILADGTGFNAYFSWCRPQDLKAAKVLDAQAQKKND